MALSNVQQTDPLGQVELAQYQALRKEYERIKLENNELTWIIQTFCFKSFALTSSTTKALHALRKDDDAPGPERFTKTRSNPVDIQLQGRGNSSSDPVLPKSGGADKIFIGGDLL
jgi:hypothetical protein